MKNLGIITKTSALTLMLAASLMAGCGSGGDGSEKKGQFVDSPVIGIGYATSSGKRGLTDANGKFPYKTGELVLFIIDFGGVFSVVFPSGLAQDGIITPAHLARTANWETDDAALDMIQLLLSIDEDGDGENGIQIPYMVYFETESEEVGLVPFGDVNFNTKLANLIGELNNSLSTTLVYVNETTAIAHFKATIEKLGITIVVQPVLSDAVACNLANTAEIQGTWAGNLIPSIGDPTYTGIQTIAVEGTSLTVGETAIGSTCTYAKQEIYGEWEERPHTWIWTNGTDVYTLASHANLGVPFTSFDVDEDNATSHSSGVITLN